MRRPIRRLRPTRRAVLAAGAATGLAAGLAPRFSVAQDGRVLRVRSYSDIQLLDPAHMLSAPEGDIAMAIFAPLAQHVPGDEWDWTPVAASRLEQVSDTEVEFELMEGLVFTDGYGPVTAEDVKFSIERVADPAEESPYQGDWAVLDTVEVTGERTGVIRLTEPFAPLFASTIPTPRSCIVSRAAVEEAGGRIGAEPKGMSGQYVLAEWVPKQRTILTRNPDWPGEPGGFEEIHILPIEDPSTAELGFESGDLDYTWTAVSSLPRLKDSPPADATVLEKPSLAYVWLGMNQEVAPFDDPLVRRAVQHAIDRKAVVDAAYFGAAETSTGIVAPGLPGHREDVLYGYDPDEARRLLEEAGATDLRVTLDILNQVERLTAAQVIQANLADVGIEVEIKQNDSGTFWTLGSEEGEYWDDLQMVLGRFSMQPDPSWATAWFTPEQIGVWNWERFDSPEFAELQAEGLVETDPARRDEIYRRMQDIMEESGSYVFLTHEVTGVLHADDVVPALKPNGEPILTEFRPAS